MTDQNPAANQAHNPDPDADQDSMPADTRGAVDLSSLDPGPQPGNHRQPAPAVQPPQPGSRPAAAGGAQQPPAGADSWAIRIQPQEIQQILQHSSQVPVVLIIHDSGPASEQRLAPLEDQVDAQQGRVLLAEIDASAHPEIAQNAGELPVITAFLGGRPVGEWDASLQVGQIGDLIAQIVQAATQSGMTNKLPPQSTRAAGQGEEQAEQELPPLHQKAHEALESGDVEGAAAAYEEAIRQNPGDQDAKLGLSQVQLMQRTADVDLQQARTAAAENPDDVDAQIRVADVDVLGGHVEDAFARLVSFIQTHFGEEREKARAHLVDLYAVVGDTDPRVGASRKKLARALF